MAKETPQTWSLTFFCWRMEWLELGPERLTPCSLFKPWVFSFPWQWWVWEQSFRLLCFHDPWHSLVCEEINSSSQGLEIVKIMQTLPKLQKQWLNKLGPEGSRTAEYLHLDSELVSTPIKRCNSKAGGHSLKGCGCQRGAASLTLTAPPLWGVSGQVWILGSSAARGEVPSGYWQAWTKQGHMWAGSMRNPRAVTERQGKGSYILMPIPTQSPDLAQQSFRENWQRSCAPGLILTAPGARAGPDSPTLPASRQVLVPAGHGKLHFTPQFYPESLNSILTNSF